MNLEFGEFIDVWCKKISRYKFFKKIVEKSWFVNLSENILLFKKKVDKLYTLWKILYNF